MFSIFLAFIFFPTAFAEIKDDYNCSKWVTDRFAYTAGASNCENTISDAACRVFYKEAVAGDGFPVEGRYMDRPKTCYSSATSSPYTISNDMKATAIANCPKTCGYCCQTPAFKCSNVQYPRLNCETITSAQCNSATWRTIIAQDCPAACGFCNLGGCVDAILDCANDASICTTVGMQDFVNTYCQKTCNRCPSTTVASVSGSSCTSFIRDSSSACAGWAVNGFCTNSFYTTAQKRAYCATTCRLC